MRTIGTALFLLFVTPAAAEWCSLDSSTFTFETTFEGGALPGEFRRFDVRYAEGSALRVTVDLTAADMGDPDMNDVLGDPAWFGIETHPEAVFEASSIRETSAGQFSAAGKLSLKGVEGAATVPFSWQVNGDRAAMEGEFTLTRTNFNVGSGEWSTGESIGLDVALSFDIQLTQCD